MKRLPQVTQLLDDRPDNLWLALDSAQQMPASFQRALQHGLARLDEDLRARLGYENQAP